MRELVTVAEISVVRAPSIDFCRGPQRRANRRALLLRASVLGAGLAGADKLHGVI